MIKYLLALLIALPAQSSITGKDRLPEHLALGYVTSTAVNKMIGKSEFSFLWTFMSGCAIGFAKEATDSVASFKDIGATCAGAAIATYQWSVNGYDIRISGVLR